MLGKHTGQRLLVRDDFWGAALYVQIEHDTWEGLQDLRERRHAQVVITGGLPAKHVVLGWTPPDGALAWAEPKRVVEVPKLLGTALGDLARDAGRSVERRVVADDKLSVAGGVHVELDGGRPVLERSPDRVKRARGSLLGAALVGVGDDSAIEPGIVTHVRCLPGKCAPCATGG